MTGEKQFKVIYFLFLKICKNNFGFDSSRKTSENRKMSKSSSTL